MTHRISKLPKGVRYFFGDEVAERRAVERHILSVFSGWSYSEIVLPIFDYHELFALGMGDIAAAHTYRFVDPDGELLALRPDLTSLVARTVAARFAGVERPIRLCYSGEVFRYQEAREQRPRDFHQLGLEHIGNDRLEADIEILLVAIEALASIGLSDFKIVLSQVDLFNGMVEHLKFDAEQSAVLRRIVDSRNIVELDHFLNNFCSQDERNRFLQLVQLAGKRNAVKEARDLIRNDVSSEALEELDGIMRIAEAVGIDRYIEIDLGDVNGLDYYTGMTFKIYANGMGFPIGSGGRYDRLLENFGFNEPAVGFQLSLDRLIQLSPQPADAHDDAVRLTASMELIDVFQKAQQFRSEGKRIEITSFIHPESI